MLDDGNREAVAILNDTNGNPISAAGGSYLNNDLADTSRPRSRSPSCRPVA